MFVTKRRMRILWITVFFSLVGTLVLTLLVFAQFPHDETEHNKGSHYHVTSGRSANNEVEWRVGIGNLDWNDVSTYVWHKVFAQNNGNNRINVEWEWSHEVTSDVPLPEPLHDTIFKQETFAANRRGDQELTKQGYTSVDLPMAGRYRIRAYTEVTMYRGNTELTKPPAGQPRKNKRKIKSIGFEAM